MKLTTRMESLRRLRSRAIGASVFSSGAVPRKKAGKSCARLWLQESAQRRTDILKIL